MSAISPGKSKQVHKIEQSYKYMIFRCLHLFSFITAAKCMYHFQHFEAYYYANWSGIITLVAILIWLNKYMQILFEK